MTASRLIPVLLLLVGCADSSLSRPVIEQYVMDRSELVLQSGDLLKGHYFNCRGYGNGDLWTVDATNPGASTLAVIQNDKPCELWLSQLQISGQTFSLYRYAAETTPEPVRLGTKYSPAETTLLKDSNGNYVAFLNAKATGLDFAGSSFTISVITGVAATTLPGLTFAVDLPP